MSAPTVETLLVQAQELLADADKANHSGHPQTYDLQRQARELIGACIDRCAVLGRDMDAQPTPECPIHIAVDGEIGATELARRLARGGLALKNGEHGQLVLIRGTDAPTSAIRQQLFRTHAIVEAVRLAIASKLEAVDIETTVGDSLQVVSRMIDEAAAELAND